MINDFLYIDECLTSDENHFRNFRLNDIFKDYLFLNVSEYANLTQEQTYILTQNIKKSKVIIIDEIEEQNDEISKKYYLFGFEKSLLIHEQSPNSISFISTLFSFNSQASVCFLSDKENIFSQIVKNTNPRINIDFNFSEEIKNFSNYLRYTMRHDKKISIMKIWPLIIPCISGYLIKKSYLKLPQFRITEFLSEIDKKTVPKIINKDEYIELRLLGKGSLGNCFLIYLIEQGELCVVKKLNGKDIEEKKLLQRETENYQRIRHPFIPKFIGTVKGTNYIVIEFIKGQTLTQIKKIELTYDERNTIIFELMVTFWYLHSSGLIYRDLKTNNVIIDENKTVVLIDFDRLIENNPNFEETNDLSSQFKPPEYLKRGIYSYEGDIYSLGMMLKYIMTETNSTSNLHQPEDSEIEEIVCMCINETVEKRPTILEIIQKFITKFQSNIRIEKMFKKYDEYYFIFEIINKICKNYGENQDDPAVQFNIGLIYAEGKYVTREINKAIHYFSLAANQNLPQAQFNLGIIYYNGEYVTRDINKAIHYFSLAANQNFPLAQHNLGFIYNEGKYVTRDINKAIHYYSLAANQNNLDAQRMLGIIYYEEDVVRDVNKSIHYFTLGANQNDPIAQMGLSCIYGEGKYVKRNISKAIHYISLAANQNNTIAQFALGCIYYENEYTTTDIDKAIHYFSLAADKGESEAQFYLGRIYEEGKYVARDINKSIHYYSLSAKQHYPEAQFSLGRIYEEEKYAKHDIDKAIHYYSLAANQNYPEAQFNLGRIYEEGKYAARDINKAIQYYTISANQNYSKAQFNLGLIYFNRNRNINEVKKGIYYIMYASKNGFRQANFAHGFLLHEGKYIKRDIEQAVHYYKEASSFNNQYAKNNLGIIYKHGYDNVKGRAGNAIVYFEEAIRQKDDYLSMYNLAHIYTYDETISTDYDKSIELLIKSYNKANDFDHSLILLCLVLIKKYGYDFEIIKRTIEKRSEVSLNLTTKIDQYICNKLLLKNNNFETLYETYRNNEFVYNIKLKPISSQEVMKEHIEPPKYPKIKNISSLFYEGFGIDIK